MASSIRRHVFLQELSLVDCTVMTKDGLAELATLPRLRRLDLQGCRLGDSAVCHFRLFQVLEHLVLAQTDISDAGVAALCQFPNMQRLLLLNLNDCAKLTGEVVCSIGSNLLALLRLSLAGIPVEDVQPLAKCVLLRRLSLARTTIGNGQLKFLRPLVDLRELDLQDTLIPGLELQALVGLQHLRRILLPSRGSVGDSALHVLASKF